eukprot:8238056-Karenia_brevis.AAC.1
MTQEISSRNMQTRVSPAFSCFWPPDGQLATETCHRPCNSCANSCAYAVFNGLPGPRKWKSSS